MCESQVKKKVEVERKVISLKAWTGAEGSRRLRPPDFKIS
jgi:hypothetical protein